MPPPGQSMEPLSARIPSDLYLWLARLPVEGATTNSDKLRVLLGQLKRQHDGGMDYPTAHAWARDITATARNALVRAEAETSRHSEVLEPAAGARHQQPGHGDQPRPHTAADAARLEDMLVRRAFALAAGLLRQAATTDAEAYDPGVVRRHMAAAVELASSIHQKGE